jgi:hypothetical protein
VINQVAAIGNAKSTGSWKKVEVGRGGGGQLCTGMAQLFHDVLIFLDIPTRRVLLQRNVFDVFDTHPTIEAFVGGKWRVYAPTFDIALKTDGARIGAYEAQNMLLISKVANVQIEFFGDVRYPARINSYPIRYKVHFDNAQTSLDGGQPENRAFRCFEGRAMRKLKFTESQIMAILGEGEAGLPVVEVCRRHGISKATYYQWKSKYVGMSVAEARQLFAAFSEVRIDTLLTHGDVLESGVAQRHRGALPDLARRFLPPGLIRQFFRAQDCLCYSR